MMAKFRDGLVGPTVILFLFCAVTTLVLAFTNTATEPLILQARQEAADETRQQVLPGADSFAEWEGTEGLPGGVEAVYEARNGTGYVFTSAAKGYNGAVTFLIGVNRKGEVTGVNMFEDDETPGLGARVGEDFYKDQYVGNTDNESVDKIQGATLTSNALKNAVGQALSAYQVVTTGTPAPREETKTVSGLNAFLIILVSVILVDNYVLSKFLGICPFLGVSKKLDSALGMSVAVTFVMIMATAVTWPINNYLLGERYAYLQTIVFILVIASVVQFIEVALKKYMPALHKALGVYLPLITTNCAVLGVTLLNITESYSFLQSIVNSLGAGLGFMLAMVLFAGVRRRMESCAPPKSFDGIPITLVAASILAVSFLGFSGVVDGLFG